MQNRSIHTFTLPLFMLVSVAARQPVEPMDNGAADASTTTRCPEDVELGHGYVWRDGAIHFIGGGVTGVGADATRIDTPSPKLLRKVVSSHFGPFQMCQGLDVASFEALSEQYTRDKDRVYFKVISTGEFLVIRLADADPGSFQVLATHLARDKDHVWYYERIQVGVDPATVVSVDGWVVFKDDHSVRYGDKPIRGADPVSFRHVSSGYYVDKSRAYWSDAPVEGADPATLVVLGESFIAKDKTSVYRSGKRLPHLDVASTELILHDPQGHQFLSDKNGVYLNDMTFPRSKPGKVEVVDSLTVQLDDVVYLVSTYQVTPVTVFKEEGVLKAETFVYDPTHRRPLGMLTAVVTEDGLEDIRTAPLTGNDRAPSVPDWQLAVFKGPDLVRRMLAAGTRIE